ncbi:MAG: (2Fe-2S)-binding protein [Burkholderiaceae bacterium]|nr:(2Fe-2S)-binding protein [Burkholderiaceae bacterium]
MIVCVCRRVSDRDIEREVHRGCPSFEDLQIDLGVATSCGTCTVCAVQVFEKHVTQARCDGSLRYQAGATGTPVTLHLHREVRPPA